MLSHKLSGGLRFFALGALCLLILPYEAQAAKDNISKGVFLVATENLNNTGFQKSVILITHNSSRGSTGLAINRPSQIPLNQYFPKNKKLQNYSDDLFLGGPVRPDTIFVLMKTLRPHAGMYKVAEDLYFTRGLDAITHSIGKKKTNEHARAYAGYSGWAPGQLNAEIDRGDWIVVRSDPAIVFSTDFSDIWKKLFPPKAGRWI